MPVNTAALKTFAPAMRRQLMEAVGRKLDLLLHQASADTLTSSAGPIEELRQQEAHNRQELLERVAYSWFNRLAALRYLDARGWHPFGARVLMPQTESETQPELLKLLRSGSLPAELQPHTDEARLQGLLDGRIPTAMAGADPHGEVYRELILAVCRSYHQLLPTLFEGLDDASELMLPDDLLSDGSIAGGFRSAISDTDCEDVEIIGWLYQFYISEKKDQVIGKVVKSEDIPAATQLFTPNWIVKYMVQNSLGAQWLATYPSSALKGYMEYYIEPAEQTDDVKAQLAAITPESLNPEELTLIDPACGSGHILVEAYELFKAIYLECGYQQQKIPQLILQKNLFGLDIDERAAQLTSFALMMKGRGDDRRLFERGIQLNVMAMVNSDGLDFEALANAVKLADHGLKLSDLVELKQLFEHATTVGALIQVPDGMVQKLPALRRLSALKGQDMLVTVALERLEPLARQAELLAARYDAVVANPPYMGAKSFAPTLKGFLKSEYCGFDRDLFAAFICQMIALTRETGNLGIMTSFVWMFISSFERLRRKIVDSHTLVSLVQLHYDAFADAKAHVCTFIVRKKYLQKHKSSFVRLSDFPGVENQEPKTLEAIRNHECGWFFETDQDDFAMIPGRPIAYWAGARVRSLFASMPKLADLGEPRRGLQPGNTPKHVRYWHEVDISNTAFSVDPEEVDRLTRSIKWVGFTSGGDFRKWAGNLRYVVNWQRSGYDIKNGHNPIVPNEHLYFQQAITWSKVTSSFPSFRKHPAGAIPGDAGPFAVTQPDLYDAIFASLNARHTLEFLKILAPTVNFQVGDVGNVPVLVNASASSNVCILIRYAEADWNSFERSWEFKCLPLLDPEIRGSAKTLQESYCAWIAVNRQIVCATKELEEENNRIYAETFGLLEEFSLLVPVDQVTLTVNPAYRYNRIFADHEWSNERGFGEELEARFLIDSIREFISYSTGCMMGRYSLDLPGLILAIAGDTLEQYIAKVGKSRDDLTFQPDRDGIIPVLDGEWFEDDIVARSREFLRVCFPASSLNTDLAFIETALGKDLRKYFCTDFYKDHLQTYKKRPIYWLVQSPAGPAKGGFACLIYLHRYTKDTLNQVLNNYFRPYLQKLEARLAQLGLDQLNDDLPARERTAARKEAEKITKVLKECQAWEQDALLPLAQQRIELDLDDGVKVNYLKLQDVLAPIPGLAAKED